MMRRFARLALVLVTLAGCRASEPDSIGAIEPLLAFVEIPAVGDREQRAAQLTRSAPWGRPDDVAANVVFAHELGPGAWSVIRTLPTLRDRLGSRDCLLIAPPDLAIDPATVTGVLKGRDPALPWFLGRSVRDSAPTPIHHYAEASFAYPDSACGIVLSRALVEALAERWATAPPARDMTIDAPYELAQWIRDGGGPVLTDVPELCGRAQPAGSPSPVAATDVVFAVRTYSGFHRTRVPIVQATWGARLPRLVFYSDIEDRTIPTVATGVPNVTRGHCEKLRAVLRLLRRDHADARWAVVADDDTLFDVPALLARLGDYDPTGAQPIVVGRRYGVAYNRASGGYDFATLGAGMAISQAALARLVDRACPCPRPDAPDDMWLGGCLREVGIDIVNDEGFHQEQPSAYPAAILAHARALSFHRFEPGEPLAIYRTFLDPARSDRR
jgi:UDP-glucose:O-linked fucose beta-1,3-glucosyltransferase